MAGRLSTRLAALEKLAGLSAGPQGTVEVHSIYGSVDPNHADCDRRPEHGPACVYKVVSRNRSGTRFMRLYGFDVAGLD